MTEHPPAREHLLMHLTVSRSMRENYRASLELNAAAIALVEQEIEAEMAETGEPFEATQGLRELKRDRAQIRYDLDLTEQDIAHYVRDIRRRHLVPGTAR